MIEMQWDAATKAVGHRLDLVHRLAHFEEKHIRARLDIGLSPLERFVQTFDHQSVAAGDDDEVLVSARIEGRADLLHHLFLRYQPLAEHVAASLRPHLVFDVNARDTSALELAYG